MLTGNKRANKTYYRQLDWQTDGTLLLGAFRQSVSRVLNLLDEVYEWSHSSPEVDELMDLLEKAIEIEDRESDGVDDWRRQIPEYEHEED